MMKQTADYVSAFANPKMYSEIKKKEKEPVEASTWFYDLEAQKNFGRWYEELTEKEKDTVDMIVQQDKGRK